MNWEETKQAVKTKINPTGESESLLYEVLHCDSYSLADIPKWTPQPDVILDLGSNIGVFAVAARLTFPNIPIICIEPANEAFVQLQKNVSGLPNITCLQVGLGEDGGFIGEVSTGGSLGSTFYGKCPNGKIPSMRLSSIKQIDWNKNVLVKFDSEGGEIYIAGHPESEACLKKAWLIVGELHWGKRFMQTRWETWMKWVTDTLYKTHIFQKFYNSQPTRNYLTESGNIQLTAVRRDVKTC